MLERNVGEKNVFFCLFWSSQSSFSQHIQQFTVLLKLEKCAIEGIILNQIVITSYCYNIAIALYLSNFSLLCNPIEQQF